MEEARLSNFRTRNEISRSNNPIAIILQTRQLKTEGNLRQHKPIYHQN